MPTPSNLVHQQSTTTGTGNLTLSSVNGKRTFTSAFGTGGSNVFDYFVSSQGAAEWEYGTAHIDAGTGALVRDTVTGSSNSNALVSFSAGTLDIANDVPAEKQIYDADDLNLTIAEMALQIADNTNVSLFLGSAGNRLADSFDVLTYVNTGGATNLDSGTAGLLKPSVTGGTQIAQATGTVIGDAGQASNAFDSNSSQSSGACAFKNPGTSMYVGKNLGGSSSKIASVTVFPATDIGLTNSGGNATVNLRGSNSSPASASSGTLLGTVTRVGSLTTSFSITSTDQATSYQYVWVELTAASSALTICELQFFIPTSTNNLTVTSATLTAAAAPTQAKLVARVKEIDSITLNTDLIFSVSRDGGTTYTSFTMTDNFTASGAHVLSSNSLDISGQPSGTSMRWKAVTANNKSIEIWDVYLYWK